MPGKVKVRVLGGRNLPVMDRSSDTTDAYVEVKLGSTTQKTDVYRKSLNPQWNSEWFIFEVDDLDLQDEPLQIRIMDHDTYSANDAIGKVYVDLNPLLLTTSQQPSLLSHNQESSQPATVPLVSGWLPVYDTMHGIRGEVNIIVKVDLFSDFNKFRQSSCGVQFFFNSGVPSGYKCQTILGFVEELVVNDDPEYQWIDKIRTPRASNEARQTLFFKLSGELQRRIGLKVLELGGNAVIGYRQCFDLEGDYGIVVRGLGSAVTLAHLPQQFRVPYCTHDNPYSPSHPDYHGLASQRDFADFSSHSPTVPNCSPKRVSRNRTTSGCCSISRSPQQLEGTKSPTHSVKATSPSHQGGVMINRRSSDSDLSITPKGSLGSGGSSGGKTNHQHAGVHQAALVHGSFDMMEFPFLSMKSFPSGFVLHVAGTVSAKAVKLLDRNRAPEEVETRDSWWMQVRTEVRSHAKALGCNVILGYEEYTTMCDDVCVLGASGTAAVVNINYHEPEPVKPVREIVPSSVEKRDVDSNSRPPLSAAAKVASFRESQQTSMSRSHPNVLDDVADSSSKAHAKTSLPIETSPVLSPCHMCHIPYSETSLPFKVKLFKCAVCRKGKVPDILFTTLELPRNFPVVGRGCLIQARVARTRKDLKGEPNAKEISDALPFLEYEIYRQLYNKIKIKGMNMLFDVRVRVTIGERFMIGIATATAVFAAALPPMSEPKIITAGGSVEDKKKRAEVQKKIVETVAKNRHFYGLKTIAEHNHGNVFTNQSDSDDSDEDLSDADLSTGNKDAFVLELDDLEDAEMIKHLVKCCPINKILTVSTEIAPGIPPETMTKNLQMFTKVWRIKIPPNLNSQLLNSYFDKLMQSLFFKVRKLNPCIISGLEYNVELPDEDEVQISILGMVIAQKEVTSMTAQPSFKQIPNHSVKERKKLDDSDLIFRMEEVGLDDTKKGDKGKCKPWAKTPSGASFASYPSFNSVPSVSSFPSATSFSSSSSSARSSTRKPRIPPPVAGGPFGVELTPLSFIPGARIDRYLGNLNFFFIRESTSIKECGGLSGFMGCFVSEVLALARAHVAAVGGNALTSFFLSECILYHNLHKNQGQCLINVGGDIVQITHLQQIRLDIETEA